ncbi:Uncharacterised protein [Shigella sonnei]|nr:Uncharacterised protein [Shigella sonnei]CSF01412.1 Uncharacterised protein [Shigella sonnei]CSG06435.1 Uncharacterised protein [Shigella sonnei]CSH45748.1 Uncharacterised protein [Shigella sonnei]
MQKAVCHHEQMFQPTRLRLLSATAHRARTAKRHRWNAKCFYPLQIQGIERLKERGLQFILHIAPPLSLAHYWRSPAGS